MSEDGSSPLRYAVNNDVCLPSAQMSARHCLPWNAPALPACLPPGGNIAPPLGVGLPKRTPAAAKRAFPFPVLQIGRSVSKNRCTQIGHMVSKNSRKNKKAGLRLTDLDNKREVVSFFSPIFGSSFHNSSILSLFFSRKRGVTASL